MTTYKEGDKVLSGFINKDNAIYLSHKYNYTEAGIRKITSRVNNNIKALN